MTAKQAALVYAINWWLCADKASEVTGESKQLHHTAP